MNYLKKFSRSISLAKMQINDFGYLNSLGLLEGADNHLNKEDNNLDERYYHYKLIYSLEESELIILKDLNEKLTKKLKIKCDNKSIELSIKDMMDKLHKYNDTKDVLQSMIAKIALYKDTTIRQINKELEVSFDEEK